MTRPHHPKHDSKITAPPIQPSSRVRPVIRRTAPVRRVVNMGFPLGGGDIDVELRSRQVARVAPNLSSVSW